MTKRLFILMVCLTAIPGVAQVGAIVGGVVGGVVGKVAGKKIFSNDNLSQGELLEIAVNAANEKSPSILDENTRLDGATVEPDHSINYHYTTLKLKRSEVNTKVFYTEFSPELRVKACANAALHPLFKKQIKAIYSYKSSDNKYIGSVIVVPKDCGY